MKLQKIAYIAHPVGGDVKNNMAEIAKIGRLINTLEPDVIPFAPYYFDLFCLNDHVPEERAKGLANGVVVFERRMITELRLYGSRISEGMKLEIELAGKYGIPIIPMTIGTTQEYKALYG